MSDQTGRRFLVNLRAETFTESFRDGAAPAGYLLSPVRAGAAAAVLAAETRAAGFALLVDNGNFTAIGRVAAEFGPAATVLLERVRAVERRLGRAVRRGELPGELRAACADLARRAAAAAAGLVGDGDRNTEAQLGLSPSALVGVEDVAMAVWLAVGFEPVHLGFGRRDYRRRNERVARLAGRRARDLPAGVDYYPVASALSYDTAFDAGAVFAAAGLTRAAMGFGAYMADDSWADHLYLNRRRVDLPARFPNRYLRTAVVARGFWDGYRSRAGAAPAAFHFLGLGAPIMIPVVALAGAATPLLSFDATSPIKDAAEGTFYFSRPAYLKVKARRAAFRLASTADAEWRCPCRFCAAFTARRPFDYPAGRAWFNRARPSQVTAADLGPSGALFDAYPLLSEPAAGVLRREVTAARVGHNHWALKQVTAALEAVQHDRAALDTHVEGVVADYENASADSGYAAAVRAAQQLAVADLTDLRLDT